MRYQHWGFARPIVLHLRQLPELSANKSKTVTLVT